MYSKEEIIEFFISAANPAIEDFRIILKGHDWKVDPQIHGHYFVYNELDNKIWREVQSIDGKIWSKIDAFKPDMGAPEYIFSYQILAEPTDINHDGCLLKVRIIWKNEFDDGEINETYEPYNISTVTKDEFLKHVKMAYDNYRRMN